MINNIAIYHNKQRNYITVFAFSTETISMVTNAISRFGLKTKGEPRIGNKPGSLKFAVYTTRDYMNECLESIQNNS